MIELGWVVVKSLEGERARVVLEADPAVALTLYLPVLERPGQAGTAAGSRILAIFDTVTGLAVVGYNASGFAFKFSSSVNISGDLGISGDASASDFAAGGLSLLGHTHATAPTGPTAPPTPYPAPAPDTGE